MIPIGPYLVSSEITMAEKNREKNTSMATYSTPVEQAAGNSARHEILPASKIRIEGQLVDLLQRGGRGDPAEHEEHHRRGPDDGAGSGRRRSEQVTGIGRSLAVQAGGPGQRMHHRPAGQRAYHDEERKEAQQQRGGEQHAPVDDIHRVQPTPQVFSQGPGVLLLAPLSYPPDTRPANRRHACPPRSRLARGLTRGAPGLGGSIRL